MPSRIVSNIGKFIRRLHFFDWLIILIGICIVGFFLYSRLSKKTEWISIKLMVAHDEWWWTSSPPQYWYTDSLEPGMSTYNSFGEKVAEITDVQSFDNGGYGRRAFVDIKVKGFFDKKRQLYLFNFQPLQIGKKFEQTFGKNNLSGIVTYIEQDGLPSHDRIIEVKLYGIRDWHAEEYKTGLEMKDSQGRVLAKVINVQSELASWYEFSDIRGRKILITDPTSRNLTIRLQIKTFESGGNEHFVDRAVIKIGEEIWFQFPTVAIRSGIISKIIE